MSNRHFQRRYQSVEMEPMDDSSDNSNQTWLQDGLNSMQLKRSQMNELIMDYLVHEGFREAAERFREEAGINPYRLVLPNEVNEKTTGSSSTQMATADGVSGNPPSANSSSTTTNNNNMTATTTTTTTTTTNNNNNNNSISNTTKMNDNSFDQTSHWLQGEDQEWCTMKETVEMIDKRIEVRRAIEEGEILKAQSLINLYYPELLDNQRLIYFKLQQQHLIELIRQQRINDVLEYVHDQLSVDELRDLTEMERTLALLAYEHPDKSPYASLLHSSHRLQLASEINDIILIETTGQFEKTKPRLVTLLKLLFWTQSELERKKIQFPKMTDLVNGTILEPRH